MLFERCSPRRRRVAASRFGAPRPRPSSLLAVLTHPHYRACPCSCSPLAERFQPVYECHAQSASAGSTRLGRILLGGRARKENQHATRGIALDDAARCYRGSVSAATEPASPIFSTRT